MANGWDAMRIIGDLVETETPPTPLLWESGVPSTTVDQCRGTVPRNPAAGRARGRAGTELYRFCSRTSANVSRMRVTASAA
ncbi:Uncharacterised protein [Mycobacteroides abscessus subsp. bolletii]|nr:Uncharacterised protein [Mycobacteroides abscessus subsp. bolletii]SII68729.1 Uncharacterised protein [Mycobacteroides abscessus subsp. bolletii]SKS55998.1 Uncharacterised protein [Mycobacteroides abscessus subsp. bolletii]SKT04148.1 Uncharacterised protein [Mycobacteroides abscessus subsp. bolletii]SLD18390.1 Uncharacterised protein [Mycobacteroides abscessus subsp. bolletii]